MDLNAHRSHIFYLFIFIFFVSQACFYQPSKFYQLMNQATDKALKMQSNSQDTSKL